jgi:TPR repeat protein
MTFEEATDLAEKGEFQAALDSFIMLAELGDSKACVSVADIYTNGLGVALDLDKAIYWELKAIGLGEKTALLNLGISYRMKGDCRQARLYFEKAILADEGNALFELARLLDVSDLEKRKVVDLLNEAVAHEWTDDATKDSAKIMLIEIEVRNFHT